MSPLVSRKGAKSVQGFGFANFPCSVPSRPDQPGASRTNQTTVSISWFPDSTSQTCPIQTIEIESSPAETLTYDNTDLTSPVSVTSSTTFNAGQSYQFRIRFANCCGNSEWSPYSSGVVINTTTTTTTTSGTTTSTTSLRLCTTFQISLGCCTLTTSCGSLGAGSTCSPASGTFNPGAC